MTNQDRSISIRNDARLVHIYYQMTAESKKIPDWDRNRYDDTENVMKRLKQMWNKHEKSATA